MFYSTQISACASPDDGDKDGPEPPCPAREQLTVDPGVTPGGGSATAQGAYVYSVPITLPPASVGPTPELSLEYNSQNPKPGSPLGVGWHLDGIPSIHRCGKMLRHDGRRGGVDYTNRDRLCKDGIRLIGDEGGDDAYWNSEAFYPEGDPGTKIVLHETPRLHFVELQRGRITATYDIESYVVSDDSNRVAGRWHLREIADRNGNLIRYWYTFDDNVAYLANVVYDRFALDLTYEALPADVLPHSGTIGASWASGSYSHNRRCTQVSVHNITGSPQEFWLGSAIRTYHLNYNETSYTLRRSLLTSVQECTEANPASEDSNDDGIFSDSEVNLTQCRRPLVFGWNNHELTGTFTQTEITPETLGLSLSEGEEEQGITDERLLTGAQLDTGATIQFGSHIRTLDWNSDRFSDILRQEYCDRCDGDEEWNIFRDTNSLTMHLNTGGSALDFAHHPNLPATDFASETRNEFDNDQTGTRLYIGDFDGNRTADVFTLYYGGSYSFMEGMRLHMNPGRPPRMDILGFDNAYEADVSINPLGGPPRGTGPYVMHGLSPNHVYEGYSLGWEVVVGDFDGDVKSDLLILPGLAPPGQETPPPYVLLSIYAGSFEPMVADFGDNNSEFQNSLDWTPAGYTGEEDDRSFGSSVRALDLNNDGLDDLIRQRHGHNSLEVQGHTFDIGGLDIFLTTGDGNFQRAAGYDYPNEPDGGFLIQFADFNGDANLDMLTQGTGPSRGSSPESFRIRWGYGDGTFSLPVVPGGDIAERNLAYYNHDRVPTDWDSLNDSQKQFLTQIEYDESQEENIGDTSNILLFDFNGDGRTDMLSSSRFNTSFPGGYTRIFLSNGDGSFEQLGISTNLSRLCSVFEYRTYYWEHPRNPDNVIERFARAGTHISTGDFQADGFPDLLVQKWDAYPQDAFEDPERPSSFEALPTLSVLSHPLSGLPANNTISTVRTGIVTTEVNYDGPIGDHEYDPFTQTRAVPPAQLVGSITTRPDAASSGNRHAPVTTVTYEYAGPLRSYFSDFLGFARVVETHDADNATVETQGDVSTGQFKPKRVIQSSGGVPVSTVTNTWGVGLSPHGVRFAKLTNSVQEQHFGCDDVSDCTISSTVEYRHDDYSNLTGRVTQVNGREPRYELFQYFPPTTDGENWVIDEVELTRDSAEDAIGEDLPGTVKRYRNDLGQIEKLETTVNVRGDQVRKETVEFRYDEQGRVNRTWHNGNQIDFDHSDPDAVTTTVGAGTDHVLTSTVRYNRGFGVPLEHVDNHGRSRTIQYDSFGQRTSDMGPDEQGNSQLLRDYGFRHDSTEVDGTLIDVLVEQVWTATNWQGCGYLTETAYTVYGHPVWTRVSDSTGENIQSTVNYEHDSRGRLYRQSLPFQTGETPQYTQYFYNDQYRLDRVVPPFGAETNIVYDTHTSFCDENQVLITQGQGTRGTMSCQNLAGDTTRHWPSGLSLEQVREFDYAGRIVRQYSSTDDEISQETTFGYDGVGRLIWTDNDERGRVDATYDVYGRLERTWHTDRDGEIISEQDHTFDTNQDPFGRLTSTTGLNGENISYEYYAANNENADNRGRLFKVTVNAPDTPVLSTEYEYHPTGQVAEETRSISDESYPFKRSYTPMGQLAHQVSPIGSKTDQDTDQGMTLYGRDEFGRLTKIEHAGKLVGEYKNYDATGRYRDREFLQDSSGIETHEFYEHQRLKTASVEIGGETRQDQEFTYNDFGELYELNDSAEESNDQVYFYNRSGFLTHAFANWDGYPVRSYFYHANGDLKNQNDLTYAYDRSGSQPTIELRTRSGQARHRYHFDSAGRLTQRELDIGDSRATTDEYSYNGLGLLEVVSDSTGGEQLARFGYDQDGQRFYRSTANDNTYFIDPTFEVDVQGDEVLYTEHVFGPDGRAASYTYRVSDSADHGYELMQERHYVGNQVGSTSMVVDGQGDILAHSRYEPFGGEYSVNSSELVQDTAGYGFAGQMLDASTGLHYFNARYYDHLLGRFTQADSLPIGTTAPHATQFNRYSYAANNPVNYTDPSGNIAPLLYAIIVGIMISSAATLLTHMAVATINHRTLDFKQLGIDLAVGAVFSAISIGAGSIVACQLGRTASGIALGAAIDTGLTAAEGYATAGGNPNHGMIWGMAAGAGVAAGVGTAMAPCFAAGTPVLTDEGQRPIEELQLGDYVVVPEDGPVEEAIDDPNHPDSHANTSETEWVVVRMHRIMPNSSRQEVELLRPESWVFEHGLYQGATFEFEASEENLSGRMTVDSIRPLQQDLGAFQSTDGQSMITGRFVTQKAQVYRVTFDGVDTEILATGNHPLYSLDDNDWVAVRDLEPEDTLRTHTGSVVVDDIEQLTELETVYNLEINGVHVYFVGNSRILAHNMCDIGSSPAGPTVRRPGPDLSPGADALEPPPYRPDFYRAENIIGYTGDINNNPTVYYRRYNNNGTVDIGHITQAHRRLENIGRESVYNFPNNRYIQGNGYPLPTQINSDTPLIRSNMELLGYNSPGTLSHLSRTPFTRIQDIDYQDLWKLNAAHENVTALKPLYR